jgi:hypothetical protein
MFASLILLTKPSINIANKKGERIPPALLQLSI